MYAEQFDEKKDTKNMLFHARSEIKVNFNIDSINIHQTKKHYFFPSYCG